MCMTHMREVAITATNVREMEVSVEHELDQHARRVAMHLEKDIMVRIHEAGIGTDNNIESLRLI